MPSRWRKEEASCEKALKSHARGARRQRCRCGAVGCEDNDRNRRREVGDGEEVVERIMYFLMVWAPLIEPGTLLYIVANFDQLIKPGHIRV